MPRLLLEHLVDHPDNSNRMSAAMLGKLTAHVRASGRYPPLIVRPHPAQAGRYQILDGHHRAKALRSLGHTHANCEVWPIEDDAQAALLLATLNRLQGEDDPLRRGALLQKLSACMDVSKLLTLLPEERVRLDRLLAAAAPPPSALAPPPDLAAMPTPVTFFLLPSVKARLMERLASVHPNPSEALMRALGLGEG